MKIENVLRTMASFLQAQLKDVETLIAQEKEDKAQEALNFTQGGLKNFANEIEKVDGGFYGLVGILFRRAYHVPDDIKKLREALFQEAERLQKLLAKNSEKNRNKLKQSKPFKQANLQSYLPKPSMDSLRMHWMKKQSRNSMLSKVVQQKKL